MSGTAQSSDATRQIPIAITGLGCRFPGCDDPQSYWEMILRGESRIAPAPAERFDRDLYFDAERGNRNKSYTDLACTIDYERADTHAAHLPPAVRACPERAFTTLYLAADQALSGADGNAQTLPQRTGVYVGHTRKSGLAGRMIVGTYIEQIAAYLEEVDGLDPEHRERAAEALRVNFRQRSPRRNADGSPDLSSLNAASLISRGLGLDGPAMVFNSACASSLNALAQAVRALQLGTIDAAIVGSASHFHQDTLVLFSHAQSLSPNGSHPFDESADGIVVGEGYAAVVLRRESDAIAEGLPREAVIRGVGISSDGKGKSLWAPRAEGQRLAVQRAYATIPDQLAPQYVEAHATGTQLGDATELSAIADCLEHRNGADRIAVGSVKSNIGHTLESAGLAGLIKAVLSVRHGVIPPTTGIRSLNPKIAWDELPFEVPTEPQSWPQLHYDQPRRAAINAFGIGGLNVHVVIDQATDRGVQTAKLASQTSEPIAIVSVGMMAAGCTGLDAFQQRLATEQSAITALQHRYWQSELFLDRERARPWHTTSTRGGYIDDFEYDWRRHKIPPKQVAHASPVQFMILEAVEEALRQAFGDDPVSTLRPLAERTGVIVGTMFGGDFANQLLMGLRLPEFQRLIDSALQELQPAERQRIAESFRERLLGKMPALLDETGSFTSSSLASRLTKTLDLFGGAVAVDAGLCSSFASLQCAADLLRSGDNDLMICVAAQEDMTPTRFEALALSGDLARDGEPGGIVPGEGCVVMILRRESDAKAAGQTILGRIGGVHAGFRPAPTARLEATPTQRLIGHILGAAGHVEIAAALAANAIPSSDGRLAITDFSGLHYQVELSCAESGTQLPTQRSESNPRTLSQLMANPSERSIPQFDATQRRKQRLRDQAMAGRAPSGNSVPSPASAAPASQPVAPPAAPSATAGASQPNPSPAPVTNPPANAVVGLPPAELRQRLIDFVVDQTGYPVDMVEMDADLEADLGLDSIKKAQLLGELDEFYQLRERTDVDLDSLNSLGLIEAFLLSLQSTPAPPATAAAAPASSPHAVTPTEPSSASRPATPPTPAAPPKSMVAAAPVANPMTFAAKHSAAPSRDEIELKMVSFVVDQTGYPPDMVELDADLEADLGIDSIKKAQLLGELAEAYGLQADEKTSLDDLASLQSILDFTLQQLGSADSAAQQPAASTAPAETQSRPSFNRPVTPTDNGAAPAMEPTNTPTAIDAAQLRGKMIDYVVEQTGYPPEMVDMDADLEADLGIDSIKKAQLLGELQETYQFPTRDDLTLDDFPDLASMERFVLEMCVPPGSAVRSRI